MPMDDLEAELEDLLEPSKPIARTKTTTAAQKYQNPAMRKADDDDLDDSNDLFNMDSIVNKAKSVQPTAGVAGGFSYGGAGLGAK